MNGAAEGLWERWTQVPYRKVLIGVLLLQGALILATACGTLRRFPNSADEYAYLVSAELFAGGRLSVPSPEPRDFFALTHVVSDGKFYGKYPPGWPAILAVGYRLGVPWLVNPLLGLGVVALLAQIAREAFSEQAGRVSLLLMGANPFLVFNSASYFSHVSCLAFVLVALLGMVRIHGGRGRGGTWLLVGGAAGLAFFCRPYSAVASLAGPGLLTFWFLWRARRRAEVARGIGILLFPLLGAAILFLLYNKVQTGSFFLQPFSHYDAEDHLRIPGSVAEAGERLTRFGIAPLYELNLWVPLSGFAILLFLLGWGDGHSKESWLLFSSGVGIFIAFLLYPSMGGNRYGPRYWFESLGAVVPILAFVLTRHSGMGRIAVASVILLNGAGMVYASRVHYRQVRERMTPYDLAQRQGLRQAVVFLRTGAGSMNPSELVRNGTRFDAPVLYVHDLGIRNPQVLSRFPGRSAFLFEYGGGRGQGALIPLPPPVGVAK